MDRELAMELFERGEAFGACVSIIVMETHGKVFFSPDGNAWFESEHPAFMECIEQAKKL